MAHSGDSNLCQFFGYYPSAEVVPCLPLWTRKLPGIVGFFHQTNPARRHANRVSEGVAIGVADRRHGGLVMRGISIRAAATGERKLIIGILERCGLEPSDVDPWTTFHIAATGSAIVGCAGAERHGDTAVVGPVAVLHEFRERGVASHLVRAILMKARASGCCQAVSLSNRCISYFSRHGFLLIPRSQLPDEVRASKAYQRHDGVAPYCMRCDMA